MNMLPVAVELGRSRSPAQRLASTTTSAASATTIGFRPEAVVVGDGPIPARIRVVEDLGSEVFVHLLIDHDGEERRIVAKVDAPFVGSLRRQRATRSARNASTSSTRRR